jgi:miniconductance mechanosensitive channel
MLFYETSDYHLIKHFASITECFLPKTPIAYSHHINYFLDRVKRMMALLESWITLLGLPQNIEIIILKAIFIVIVIGLCILADFIARRVITSLLSKIVRKTKTTWDDIIVNKGVLSKLSHIAPAIVVYFLGPFIFPEYSWVAEFLQRLTSAYMIGLAVLVLSSLFDAVNDIYLSFEISKKRPIKGYLQLLKIFFTLVGIVLIIATILKKSPIGFLSGIGAMSAILILVFRDSILGFVSGIQITSNNLVQLGDWIEVPKYGADGTVIDMTLQSVRIQNWDKTISTVPLYALVSDTFKNWRGMTESGGRRIKRSIFIDMRSVIFCTPEMIEKLAKYRLLTDFIEQRQGEIALHNRTIGVDGEDILSGRRMTNVGVFRAYIIAYLKNNPKIHPEMTFLVRHLQPGSQGLPIEIYVFSNDQAWVNFEGIQADIIDHLLAVLPEFELRIFQSPSGSDIKAIAEKLGQ